MNITKTLFVEFVQKPHYAWHHINDKKAYQAIQQHLYGSMDGQMMGDMVEELFAQLSNKNIVRGSDMSQGFNQLFEEGQRFVQQGCEGIAQAWFSHGDCIIRSDFLFLNDQGTYDCYEIKAKNSIRTQNKQALLNQDLCADVSFQRYVLHHALGDKFSGKMVVVYLDRHFVYEGMYDGLLIQEDVTSECRPFDQVAEICQIMRQDLMLTWGTFLQRYPYDGSDYLTFYGKPAPEGSIWEIPYLSAQLKKYYCDQGIYFIDQIDDKHKQLLYNRDGLPTKSLQYVELFQQGDRRIDDQKIAERLQQLSYPLYFYDYETVSVPVPFMQGSTPRQHIVVQYSLHILYQDGTLRHCEYLLPYATRDGQVLVDHLMNDCDEAKHGTALVWFDSFEKKRNLELANLYPRYQQFLLDLNDRTIDLMDVFSAYHFFDKKSHGSCSIKTILPLVTDMSYDNLTIKNGSEATALLTKGMLGLVDREVYEQQRQDLLTYCQQDTLAMVKIFQFLQKR